jgi:hypothetical protein
MGENDIFFQQIESHLRSGLPVGLRHFNISDKDRNFLRLKYPEFKYSMYELHFAKRSRNHAAHFGTGHLDVAAFYFGNGATLEMRHEWSAEIKSEIGRIQDPMGSMPVKFGRWGEKWEWIAVCLQEAPVYRDAVSYGESFTRFIEASYHPIKRAFQVIEL